MRYDLIVIGGGPAGISSSIYAASRGVKVLVLEKELVGGIIGKVSTVTHYSALIENESGYTFAKRLESQALNAGVHIQYETVIQVCLYGNEKKVVTDHNTYESAAIILANGSSFKSLNIPGEKQLLGKGMGLKASKDGKMYAGRNIYVVGGGDGAFKEALYLAGIARKLTVIHFEDKPGAIYEFTKKFELLENAEIKLGKNLTAVTGKDQVEALELTDVVTGEKERIEDPGCGIFTYIGTTPNTDLYKELDLVDHYIPANEKMETVVAGVYAAGDIRVKQIRQVATAVSDGAIAGINAASYILTHRNQHK